MSDSIDQLRDELDRWRGRLDHMRVQANLGRRELEDKLREFSKEVEPIERQARERLDDLTQRGADEAKAIAASVLAGWDELLRKHRELSREREQGSAGEGPSS